MDQVCPFISQLRYILDCGKYHNAISWTPDGQGIEILDEKEFVGTVAIDTFRHRSFTSFIRQLNVYGFRKAKRKGRGIHPNVYHHPYFAQSHPTWDEKITRKTRTRSGKKSDFIPQMKREELQCHSFAQTFQLPILPSLSSILSSHFIE